MNKFLTATQSHNTLTANGAISHSTSGNPILDYFSKCGTYFKRSDSDVLTDVARLMGFDSQLAIKVFFYNRLITRRCNILPSKRSEKSVSQTDLVQRGQGRKDEFVRVLKVLDEHYNDILLKNLHLIPSVGCWKDLWYDSNITGLYYYTSPKEVYKLIKKALTDENQASLLAKFLPKIRSASNTHSARHKRLNKWAKGLCEYLGWNETEYRKFKSNPSNMAHLWQRQMCDNEWKKLDFNSIPGKALTKLVSGKGKDGRNVLERHSLTSKFDKFLDTQPVVKYTGYVHELYKLAVKANTLQAKTYNKQFDYLIEQSKKNTDGIWSKGVLCALDTSGSMTWFTIDSNGTRPYDVCLSLGVYFSSLMEGSFKNHVCSFSDTCKMTELHGDFIEKCYQAQHAGGMGSTNFQSVINMIVKIRKQQPDIPVEDFPQVLLVCSDMQFNCSGSMETNYETAMRKLRAVGLSDMTIIWWHLNGAYGKDSPSKMNDAGTVLISGFDGSIISAVLGTKDVVEKDGTIRKPNPMEVMLSALDQEVLNKVKI